MITLRVWFVMIVMTTVLAGGTVWSAVVRPASSFQFLDHEPDHYRSPRGDPVHRPTPASMCTEMTSKMPSATTGSTPAVTFTRATHPTRKSLA